MKLAIFAYITSGFLFFNSPLEIETETLKQVKFFAFFLIGVFLFFKAILVVFIRRGISIPSALNFLDKKNIFGILSGLILLMITTEPHILKAQGQTQKKELWVQRVQCKGKQNSKNKETLCFKYKHQVLPVLSSIVIPDLNLREKTIADFAFYPSFIFGDEAYFVITKIGREIEPPQP